MGGLQRGAVRSPYPLVRFMVHAFSFPRNCPQPRSPWGRALRPWLLLTAALLGCAPAVLAQPSLTSLSPTRNLRNAPRASNVALTFDQAISAGTAGNIRIHSLQRGGQLVRAGQGTVSGGGTNTVTFDPTTDFKPGETVLVTVPTTVQNTGGQPANRHVYQFTAAAAVATGTFGGGSDPGVGVAPEGVAVGDVDGDGDLDLLAANAGSSTVSVRLNNGSGTFSGGSDTGVGLNVSSVAVGDLDGDGDLDFVTANYAPAGTVSVRLNTGSGTFGGGSDPSVGANPLSVALGDVDGDGDLDLLTANYAASTVSVRLNTGSGTFGGGSDPSVGSFPRSVAVGDVDGDGDLDLLSASETTNTVSVRLNDGSGNFSGGSNPGVGVFPINVALGDLNGDGHLDLLCVNRNANTVSVRFNTGSGTFSGGSDVAVGNLPYSVAVGDVDGDGDLDLLVANRFGNSVSVRLNTGSGTFSGGSNPGVGSNPFSVVVGDVDGDGNLDLLAANRGDNSVSVRFNQNPPPALASLSPASGIVGTSITLTGANFTGATGVSFNGTAAVTFSVSSATTATATVPVGASSGPVTISTPSGTSNGVAFTVITNQAPTAIGLSPQSVTENTAGGTAIGNFSTTDPDAGDTHTYTLVSGAGSTDNGAFSINGSGQLVITASPDYETQPSYAIRVRSTDQDGLFFEQTFTISVNDVAEDRVVSNVQDIAAGTYHDFTITAGGIAILNGDLIITGTLLVRAGGVLQARVRLSRGTGCFIIRGPGNFVLAAGSQLTICDAQGISTTGATGNVQVTGGRTFSPYASYLYTNPVTGSQITGPGLPAQARELYKYGVGTLTLSQAVAVRQGAGLVGPTGNIDLNGQTLTLRSDADTTAYVLNGNGGAVLGNTAVVQRYVGGPTAVSYHHLSSPVQAAPVSDLTTAGFTPKVNAAYNALPTPKLSAANYPNVFGYDETRGGTTAAFQGFQTGYFSPATLSTTLTPGRGYSVAIGGGLTPDFVGTLTTGNVNVALSHTGTNSASNKAGWHLLGNCYPQPIDWDLLTTPVGLDASVYVWYSTGGSTGAYRTRNASGVGNLADGLIGVGQGFFVRTNEPTTFSFTNALRVEGNVPLGRVAADARPRLTLTLAQAGRPAAEADAVTVYEQAGATAGFDGAYDATRPGPNVGLPTLSALINGQEGMISAVPTGSLTDGTTVELTLTVPGAGAYALGVGALTNLPAVALLDRLTNTRYDLTTQPAVAFTAAQSGAVTGRFALVFGVRPLGTAADAASAALTLWPNPASGAASVRVAGCAVGTTVRVFDAAGRRVATAVADATGTATLAVRGLAGGVYVVQAADGRTQRLVVE